jgi:hypothetical protein
MLHAYFTPIYICFAYALLYFYTFSGTNLLTRCYSVSSLFSAVLYFGKLVREMFSEFDETKAEVNILP